MSIPDHKFIVDRVHAENPTLLQQNTPETIKLFYWLATTELHEHDPNWGMLTKTPGENHQVISGVRVSLDAAAYADLNEVADFIPSAGDGVPVTPSWGIKPRRPDNLRIDPLPFDGHVPPDDDDDDAPIDCELCEDLVKTVEDLTEALGVAVKTIECLSAKIDDLAAKLDKVESESLKVGHPVAVKGRLSLGIFGSKEITSTGVL